MAIITPQRYSFFIKNTIIKVVFLLLIVHNYPEPKILVVLLGSVVIWEISQEKVLFEFLYKHHDGSHD